MTRRDLRGPRGHRHVRLCRRQQHPRTPGPPHPRDATTPRDSPEAGDLDRLPITLAAAERTGPARLRDAYCRTAGPLRRNARARSAAAARDHPTPPPQRGA